MTPASPFIFCSSPADLARALSEHLPRPAAVVGVGNALRGDDAFGPAVVAALPTSPQLQLFDVQAVPESYLVPIVESGCPGVLFVDAAELGAEPGSVAVVPADSLSEVDVSTHAISLSLVAEAIRGLAREARGTEPVCAMLGAQPERLDRPDHLSTTVKGAVRLAAEGLKAFADAPPAG